MGGPLLELWRARHGHCAAGLAVLEDGTVMSRLAPKPQPVPAPGPAPRVEPHVRSDRFTFIHVCERGMLRTVVLPVGSSSWKWNREADTIIPLIWCKGCGLRGCWEQGRWVPL